MEFTRFCPQDLTWRCNFSDGSSKGFVRVGNFSINQPGFFPGKGGVFINRFSRQPSSFTPGIAAGSN
jgi:hypothetical protein